MKQFKGKSIYNPSGKAGEYSYWACNFYTGCSNDCNYCYCKRGVLSSTWSTKPKLKKCLMDEATALQIFQSELLCNLEQLQKHGLFFSFTTDPLLPETKELTCLAIAICQANDVPVKILTKMGYKEALDFDNTMNQYHLNKKRIAFGVTLTGHDELEPNAPGNESRTNALRDMNFEGYPTFASIEPIITFPRALDMIEKTVGVCNLYKIGLQSGKKYEENNLNKFVNAVIDSTESAGCKVYFKDSLLEQASIIRENLPSSCVTRDYNLFMTK